MSAHDTAAAGRVHVRSTARLKLIDEALRAGRCPGVKSLAALTERSERTIMRDLDALRRDFNAPLIYDPARRGWRYTEPGWTMPFQPFDAGEMLAFFTAAEVLRSTGHTPEAVLLRAALAKLSAYLPPEVSANFAALSESLTFQPIPHVTIEPATLATLARAAVERRTVSFDYHSQHRNEDNHRAADVLLLHHFAGDWYAVSQDHLSGGVRDFHAGRIRNLTLTADYFDPPANWHPADYLRRGFGMMRGGRLTTVSLVFDAYQARWMRERGTFHPRRATRRPRGRLITSDLFRRAQRPRRRRPLHARLRRPLPRRTPRRAAKDHPRAA